MGADRRPIEPAFQPFPPVRHSIESPRTMIATLARLAFVFVCLAPFALAGNAAPINNPEPVTMAALIAGSAVAGGIAYKKRRQGESEEA